MSNATADDWGWSDLTRGVTIGSITIRLAQDKDRTRVRGLSRLAVDSSRLDRLYQRIGDTGRIVSALFKADVDEVIRLQGNVASLEDLQLNTTVVLVATVDGEVVGFACAGAPMDLIAASVE
ncbi:hypothetical protein [Microbacterium sp.]|uniref:hypothetical protein n=1 Tax=Microbacterium sp. TaxID=51671 RepID=UPI003A83D71B